MIDAHDDREAMVLVLVPRALDGAEQRATPIRLEVGRHIEGLISKAITGTTGVTDLVAGARAAHDVAWRQALAYWWGEGVDTAPEVVPNAAIGTPLAAVDPRPPPADAIDAAQSAMPDHSL